MRILVPVDGSRHATAAVEFVARRAVSAGTKPEVVLLNTQPRVTGEVERLVGSDRLREIRDQDAQKVLRPAAAALTAAGMTPALETRVGSAAEHIAAFATRLPADLIVMGARGLSEFKGLFFGSETSKVIASCNTPLIVVRAGTTAGDASAGPMKVGIAVDGSDYGEAAVRYVLHHAELFGRDAEFTLIHAVPDYAAPAPAELATPVAMYSGDEIARLQAADFEQAMRVPRQLFGATRLAHREARLSGAAADAIAAYAQENRLDLLVLGSHGNGRFMSALLGSVALRVAARCTLPLLLIRP